MRATRLRSLLSALPVSSAGKPVAMEKLMEWAHNWAPTFPFSSLSGEPAPLRPGAGLRNSIPFPTLPREPIPLVAPGVHVATGAASIRPWARSLTFTGLSSSINSFGAYVLDAGAVNGVRQGWRVRSAQNDFETVVTRQYPPLKKIQAKVWGFGLRKQARMTGERLGVLRDLRVIGPGTRASSRGLLAGSGVSG